MSSIFSGFNGLGKLCVRYWARNVSKFVFELYGKTYIIGREVFSFSFGVGFVGIDLFFIRMFNGKFSNL